MKRQRLNTFQPQSEIRLGPGQQQISVRRCADGKLLFRKRSIEFKSSNVRNTTATCMTLIGAERDGVIALVDCWTIGGQSHCEGKAPVIGEPRQAGLIRQKTSRSVQRT